MSRPNEGNSPMSGLNLIFRDANAMLRVLGSFTYILG